MRAKRGFTLLEMLIVIAIVAVLVVIAIPRFSSQLERAREATCAANRRSLKGLLTTEYMTEGALRDTVAADGTVTLSDSEKAAYVCPDGGVITAKLDSSTGAVTVTCSKHAGTAASLGDADVMAAVIQAFRNIQTSNGSIDSGSASGASSKAAKVSAALRSQGLSLSDLGATMWRYTQHSSNNFGFYWTTAAAGELSAEKDVPVIKYNPSNQKYSVWLADVSSAGSGSSAYLYLVNPDTNSKRCLVNGTTDYAAALASLNAALKKSGYTA